MAGFWAGFGAQFSKEVNEIRDELREDSRTRRNYILNNGGRIVANARAKADEVLEMVNEAMAKGVSEKALLGMYQQAGASGIRKFHAALLKRPNLNAEDFNPMRVMLEALDPIEVEFDNLPTEFKYRSEI